MNLPRLIVVALQDFMAAARRDSLDKSGLYDSIYLFHFIFKIWPVRKVSDNKCYDYKPQNGTHISYISTFLIGCCLD